MSALPDDVIVNTTEKKVGHNPKRSALLIAVGYFDSPEVLKEHMVLENNWRDVDTMEKILLSKHPIQIIFREWLIEPVKTTNGNLMK